MGLVPVALAALASELAAAAPTADLVEGERWSDLKNSIDASEDVNRGQADASTALFWAAHHRNADPSTPHANLLLEFLGVAGVEADSIGNSTGAIALG